MREFPYPLSLLLIVLLLFNTYAQSQHCPGNVTLAGSMTIGGSLTDMVSDLEPTPDGGMIIAGSSNSPEVNGLYPNDPTPLQGNHGLYDFWIIKTYANGTIQWQDCFGGSSDDRAFGIEVTTDGYLVAGMTASTDGDIPANANHGSSDMWVIKLSLAGSLLWSKCYGGIYDDIAYDIKKTWAGNGYIIAGEKQLATVELGCSTSTSTSIEYWIVETDNNGNQTNQYEYGGLYSDFAHSIILMDGKDSDTNPDDGYIVAGYCRSCEDVCDEDMATVRLNNSLSVQAIKQYGAWNGEGSSAIQQTADRGCISVGISHSFQNISGDCDPYDNYPNCNAIDNSFHGVNHEVWVVKTLPNGALDNTFDEDGMRCYGGTGGDNGNYIIQTCDGGYLLIADTRSTDGDVTCNNGAPDIWVVKLNADGSIAWDESFGGALEDGGNVIKQLANGQYVLGGYKTITGMKKQFYVVRFEDPGCTCCKQGQWQSDINKFSIYPNPADNRFLVSVKDESEANELTTIEILDLFGRLILKKLASMQNGSLQQEIFLPADIFPGLYLVKAQIQERTYQQLLIVE